MCYVTVISLEGETEKVDDDTLLRLLSGVNRPSPNGYICSSGSESD